MVARQVSGPFPTLAAALPAVAVLLGAAVMLREQMMAVVDHNWTSRFVDAIVRFPVDLADNQSRVTL